MITSRRHLFTTEIRDRVASERQFSADARNSLQYPERRKSEKMAEANQTLHEIKEEVGELRVLHRELMDRLAPI